MMSAYSDSSKVALTSNDRYIMSAYDPAILHQAASWRLFAITAFIQVRYHWSVEYLAEDVQFVMWFFRFSGLLSSFFSSQWMGKPAACMVEHWVPQCDKCIIIELFILMRFTVSTVLIVVYIVIMIIV